MLTNFLKKTTNYILVGIIFLTGTMQRAKAEPILLYVAISSFIIGNTVSMTMGAYPQDIPEIPFTKSDKKDIAELKKEIENTDEEDKDELQPTFMSLGLMYARHNFFDEAEENLEKAIELDKEDYQTKGWLAVVHAKQAGAMLDLTFGIRKIIKLNGAIEDLNVLIKKHPKDSILRVMRLNILALSKSNLKKEAVADSKWLTKYINSGKRINTGFKSSIYLALINFEIAIYDGKKSSKNKMKSFLGKAKRHIQKNSPEEHQYNSCKKKIVNLK
jgi:tetratricopeptide (TPR) repeat protein